jgi:hypothetical protein
MSVSLAPVRQSEKPAANLETARRRDIDAVSYGGWTDGAGQSQTYWQRIAPRPLDNQVKPLDTECRGLLGCQVMKTTGLASYREHST